MKRALLFCTILVLVFSCSNNKEDKEATSENEVDAARNFIRAALDGKWNEANQFMLQDSINLQLLDALKTNYNTHMSVNDKRGYKDATIKFYDTRTLFDSAVIVQYSNSYMNKKDSLKVLRQSGQWMVDLKFSFPQTATPHYPDPQLMEPKDSSSQSDKKHGAQ